MVAALYVATGGCYFNLPDVDPWDEPRDARRYAGPHPVVAHPPCARWSSYWFGSPSGPTRFALGDDDGCFAAALAAVRCWGGVLEHPAVSHAWEAFGLPRLTPRAADTWLNARDGLGHVCRVDQLRFGHRARKATQLYAVGTDLPTLTLGPTPRPARTFERLSKVERNATPLAFRDFLLALARSAKPYEQRRQELWAAHLAAKFL
jgi:hypothetical protein